eukprot:jgi/Tetstr1/459780/TSEL_005133.t1
MTQPMDIDPVSRAVQSELSQFAIRAPANDIHADRRISDRRDMSVLNRFLSTIAETVHGLYWTPALEQWLLRQFDSDNETGVLYRALIDSLTPVDRENLKIAPNNPSMARNSAVLASKIVRAFQLLPEADRPNESAMAGLILSQLPEQTNARVEAAAMVAREELTTLHTLRRHLEAVDAEH